MDNTKSTAPEEVLDSSTHSECSSESNCVSDDENEPILKGKPDGICPGNRYRENKDTSHKCTDDMYLCEDCYEYKCVDCLYDDCWDERLADGVFLCWWCYRMNQTIMDIG